MLHDPYFWLGEIGLLLEVASLAVLLHRFRTESWLIILPVFVALILALNMLVRPAHYTFDHPIPPDPFLYRLGEGILIFSRVFVWRQTSLLKDKLMMDRIWRYIVVAGTMFLLYLGFRSNK